MSKNSLKPLKYLPLLLLLGAIIHSCKKELQRTTLNADDPKIKSAKSWYQTSFPKTGTNSAKQILNSVGQPQPNLTEFLEPDWNNSANYERFDDDVIEMPLDAASSMAIKATSLSSSPDYSKSSYLLLKKDNTYSAYIMTVIGEADYIAGDVSKLTRNTYNKRDPDFSGTVYYSTPQGRFVSGFYYKKGELKGQFLPKSSSQVVNENKQTTQGIKTDLVSTYQVCKDWYQTVTYEGQTYGPYYIGTTCITYIVDIPDNNGGGGGGGGGTGTGGGESGGGSGSGGGGGSGPTPSVPKPPCDVPQTVYSKGQVTTNALKTFVRDPGDGGFPPPAPGPDCPPVTEEEFKIRMTALAAKFPCAANLLNKLAANGLYGEIIQPFKDDSKPDLIWDAGQLPWFQPTGDSDIMTGLTDVNTDPGDRSASITLNQNMLQQSSQLMIASTAIHETVHAYVNFQINNAVGGFPAAKSDSWMVALSDWATLYGYPNNYNTHLEFMTAYFDKGVSILSSFDNNQHTQKEYKMAMMMGLDNAGDKATQAQKDQLKTLYDNIKAVNNISDTDLRSFYNTQLKSPPVAQKLPTTGC